MQTPKTHIRPGNIEDLYFRFSDRLLVEELRGQIQVKDTEEAIATATGIHNGAVLEELVKNSFTAETVEALAFVPMVEVAWADGEVPTTKEDVVRVAMERCQISPYSKVHAVVKNWLSHPPPEGLLKVWAMYIRGVCERLSPLEKDVLKRSVLKGANYMARAHEGLRSLFGDWASKREKEVIARIENTLATA